MTALADLEDWEELEKFSKSKKSPIGYLVRQGPSPNPTTREASPGERTRPRDRPMTYSCIRSAGQNF